MGKKKEKAGKGKEKTLHQEKSCSKTYQVRYAAGKALRQSCPHSAHAIWEPASDRPDPVKLVLESEKERVPELLPLRHGRMVRSPFTFYRGSALIMADDLSSTPNTGVYVQCCGDAHLCNFGGFATPERKIIFSINDLDETHPAPWEWDVKRLAASFVLACRDNGLKESEARDCVQTCVRTYREYMAEYSRMKTLDLWYESLGPEKLIPEGNDKIRKRMNKRIEKEQAKSRGEELFPKLAEQRDGNPIIKDLLPTIFHNDELTPGTINQNIVNAFAEYRETLPSAYQSLLDRYQIRDAAAKVVGVGSVGTACMVLLLTADENDPLFLQVKEARASVLESYTKPSVFPNHGQRVVNGYRLMLPASDMFLGWSRGPKRDFFFRQLRDTKISIRVETFGSFEMNLFANWCGRALALSHARFGNSATLSGYMGTKDTFDQAIVDFSVAYADQSEKDHADFANEIREGTVKALFEEEEA